MDGTNACLDRTGVSGSRFLQKTAKHGLAAVKQGLGVQNQCILQKQKNQKILQNGMGGNVFGPHRRKHIAFLGKFGNARFGRLQKGLGRSKKLHLRETGQYWERRKRVWTAQARADRRSCGVLGTTARQPRFASSRRAKPL